MFSDKNISSEHAIPIPAPLAFAPKIRLPADLRPIRARGAAISQFGTQILGSVQEGRGARVYADSGRMDPLMY